MQSSTLQIRYKLAYQEHETSQFLKNTKQKQRYCSSPVYNTANHEGTMDELTRLVYKHYEAQLGIIENFDIKKTYYLGKKYSFCEKYTPSSARDQ